MLDSRWPTLDPTGPLAAAPLAAAPLAAALLALAACTELPPPEPPAPAPPTVSPVQAARWPAFPADAEGARALIDAETVRAPASPRPALDADAVLEAIDRATEDGSLVVGWDAIADRLVTRPVVIFGLHHDARGQHEAFRRLFGPTGTGDGRLLALELFDNDGRWDELPAEELEGDDGLLAGPLSAGVLAQLRGRLNEGAYTAWKYDLVDETLTLVAAARGLGQDVMGCDLPSAPTARLAALEEPLRLRLRELHCRLAIRDAGAETLAVAIGDAHTGPEGMPRFFGEEAVVVRALGGRASGAGLEPRLADRLSLADPALVPLGAELLLLLPDARLGARLDRSRDPEAELGAGVTLESVVSAEAFVDGRPIPLAPERPAEVAVGIGDHALVFRAGPRRTIVGLTLRRGQAASVTRTAGGVDVRYGRGGAAE